MTDFDPGKFEEKYIHYLNELQIAYKQAFETMNDRFDSTLVHAIDQQVLNESEPFFRNGEFQIELPPDPYSRIDGVVIDQERFNAVVEEYTKQLRIELERVFNID